MSPPHALRFPPGRTLPAELSAAMERVGAFGVVYPPGYYEALVDKYTRDGVRYPHILMILGIPRISSHFFYSRALQRAGRLLDYGCGTGDNVRKLIRDGFPRERIAAFDINWSSIDLGFDLYRDRKDIGGLFSVSGAFPFGPEEFCTVYSASVFHVISDDRELERYLKNAYSALRPGGVLFGSTLGLGQGTTRSPEAWGPPRVMPEEVLAGCLAGAGFTRPAIVRRHNLPPYIDDRSMCVFEFCTQKPA